MCLWSGIQILLHDILASGGLSALLHGRPRSIMLYRLCNTDGATECLRHEIRSYGELSTNRMPAATVLPNTKYGVQGDLWSKVIDSKIVWVVVKNQHTIAVNVS